MTLQDRRTFLATVGAAAVGAAAACRSYSNATAETASRFVGNQRGRQKLARIGVQLYTVRGDMGRDLPGTLARVAQTGYTEVEFAGYFNRSPADIRALLDQNKLTAPSTHLGLNVIEQNPAQVFADSKVMGHQWVTVPSLPGRPATVDDWKRIADQFNKTAALAQAAGLRFAYHNHNAEFRKIGDVVPYDILIQNTDPALVSFEMDVYWTVNAGADPLAYFARFPGRFKMLHLKDSMGAPEHKMADVGAGTIDFKRILAQSGQAGALHFFVEHDSPTDAFASIGSSYRYLERLEF